MYFLLEFLMLILQFHDKRSIFIETVADPEYFLHPAPAYPQKVCRVPGCLSLVLLLVLQFFIYRCQ